MESSLNIEIRWGYCGVENTTLLGVWIFIITAYGSVISQLAGTWSVASGLGEPERPVIQSMFSNVMAGHR